MENLFQLKDSIGENANLILRNLGLTWDDLKGKTVADLGAQNASLATAALRHNIAIHSIDKRMPPKLPQSVEDHFIVAEGAALPFPDNSFDIVLSHAGTIDINHTAPQSTKELHEAYRIARKEIRFTSDYVPADESDHKTFRFIRDMYPNAELHLLALEKNVLETYPDMKGFRASYVRVPKSGTQ